jgi:hypothetical protein
LTGHGDGVDENSVSGGGAAQTAGAGRTFAGAATATTVAVVVVVVIMVVIVIGMVMRVNGFRRADRRDGGSREGLNDRTLLREGQERIALSAGEGPPTLLPQEQHDEHQHQPKAQEHRERNNGHAWIKLGQTLAFTHRAGSAHLAQPCAVIV